MQMLINNAGVLRYSDFDSVTAEDLLSCFRVNAIGPLILAQQLHRRGLIGSGRPMLIGNVTSKVPSSWIVDRASYHATGNVREGSTQGNGIITSLFFMHKI